jgi:hypothetical protein
LVPNGGGSSVPEQLATPIAKTNTKVFEVECTFLQI